ncbi:MAG TPA: AlpA family phage regulatory protein [Streptosporangiaceae bacterium]
MKTSDGTQTVEIASIPGLPTVGDRDRDRAPAFPDPLTADRLIDIHEIRAFFGLGRTGAYELTHRPDFPAPVRISPRCYRWWATEIAAFAIDLRDQDHPRHAATARAGAARKQPFPSASNARITGRPRMARARRRP